MTHQLHVVRVFVFRQRNRAIDYLVVRREPAHDSFWSPLTSVMRPDESIFQAAVRGVGERVGLEAPGQIVDLQLATRTLIGDLEEIDWSVGYRPRDGEGDLRPSDDLVDLQWLDFDGVYRNLESEEDRRSVMRLHFTLRGSTS